MLYIIYMLICCTSVLKKYFHNIYYIYYTMDSPSEVRRTWKRLSLSKYQAPNQKSTTKFWVFFLSQNKTNPLSIKEKSSHFNFSILFSLPMSSLVQISSLVQRTFHPFCPLAKWAWHLAEFKLRSINTMAPSSCRGRTLISNEH